jgi:hypothetical protein
MCTVRASDREASERFYDTVLPAVGLDKAGGTRQNHLAL